MALIVLQNAQGVHLGFMMVAGDRSLLAEGSWESQCVFVAVPSDPGLMRDPTFLQLAAHRDVQQDGTEHDVTVESDGRVAHLEAKSPAGVLFVDLASADSGKMGRGARWCQGNSGLGGHAREVAHLTATDAAAQDLTSAVGGAASVPYLATGPTVSQTISRILLRAASRATTEIG